MRLIKLSHNYTDGKITKTIQTHSQNKLHVREPTKYKQIE